MILFPGGIRDDTRSILLYESVLRASVDTVHCEISRAKNERYLFIELVRILRNVYTYNCKHFSEARVGFRKNNTEVGISLFYLRYCFFFFLVYGI